MKRFDQLIKDKRKEKQHTIRSLEKSLWENQGVHASRSFINLMEMGKRKPTYEIAFALADELGIDCKTALRAAYLARVDFDKNREKGYMARLINQRKITGFDVDDIVK
jgi:transcriptional regulator with XRE-family HTH domain